MGIAEMEIRSFAELHQRAWDKCKKPIVAVYENKDAIQEPRYTAKVYDGAFYTGIFMRGDDLDRVHEDIVLYVHWLRRATPGAADEPSLVCAYI